MSILNQNLLTLDFWQDKVTYGKQTVPIGTIGCAALNITDDQIIELITLCQPLSNIILMLGTGNVDVSVFPMAEKSLLAIIRFLQKTEPFSFLDLATDEKKLHRFFDEEHIENIIAYIKALQEIGAAASFDDKYSHPVGVLKLIQGMSQLGDTLKIFKGGMIDFANKLHNSKRTPDGYAAAFAEHFPKDETLSQSNSVLKETLEDAYQFSAAMVGLASNVSRAAPPSNLYTYVEFPRYNGGAGDYFLNTVLTTTYWQNIQADRALKTQQVLYQSTSTTLCCTNMYGTYSYSQGGAHEGLDFVHPSGTSTPKIYAVFEGVKQSTSMTHHLAVYDVNSPDEPKTYSYLHMYSISAGTNVSIEDEVGRQGNEGNATGYHVHFEVHSGQTTTLSSGSDHSLGSLSPYRLQDYIGELD